MGRTAALPRFLPCQIRQILVLARVASATFVTFVGYRVASASVLRVHPDGFGHPNGEAGSSNQGNLL